MDYGLEPLLLEALVPRTAGLGLKSLNDQEDPNLIGRE